ncbi:hypothetical protein ACFQ67_00100 [Streptomyces sp. NPDC056488]|uniref:hypothetical protein n=1 Tax=Streptomyces sp. NPDC056488 TaxID=3345836 RepID=UPI0036A13064
MPTPIVYAGQVLRASTINDLIDPHIQAAASFVVPSGAGTYTACVFGSVLSGNEAGMWSAAQPTRLVAPVAGVYMVHGGIAWPNALSTADARAEIRPNGTGVAASGTRVGTQRGSAGNMQVTASGTIVMAAGEYIELFLNTQSGSAITATVTLGITRVSTT